MQINKTSPVPRFLQLADILEKSFIRETNPSNRALPPIEVLANKYAVSKATVNKAIQTLTEKGLLYGEIGRGTFVRAGYHTTAIKKITIIDTEAPEWSPLSEFMRSAGHEIKKQCVNNGLCYEQRSLKSPTDLNQYLQSDNWQSVGHIFIGLSNTTQKLRSHLDEQQIPYAVVLATQKASLPDHVYKIPIDEVNATRLSLRHLIKQGHTKIAFIGRHSDASFSPPEVRYQTIQSTLKRYDIPFNNALFADIHQTRASRITGYKATEHLLKRGVPFSALIAHCDLLATGAVLCLKDHGLKIPDDVSVVGMGDNLYSRHFVPALTTLSINYSELGHRSFCALTRNEHAAPVKFKLIPRDSSASKSCTL